MGAAASAQRYDGQQEFAAKLAAPKPCVIAFMSPYCGLCASLRPALDEVASSRSGSGIDSGGQFDSSLNVAVLNAQQDKLWAPEVRTGIQIWYLAFPQSAATDDLWKICTSLPAPQHPACRCLPTMFRQFPASSFLSQEV